MSFLYEYINELVSLSHNFFARYYFGEGHTMASVYLSNHLLGLSPSYPLYFRLTSIFSVPQICQACYFLRAFIPILPLTETNPYMAGFSSFSSLLKCIFPDNQHRLPIILHHFILCSFFFKIYLFLAVLESLLLCVGFL